MRNLKSLLFGISSLMVFSLASCSDGSETTVAGNDSLSGETVFEDTEIKNQKSYNKGIEIGSRISSMEPESREREYALLEVHSLISALERNGFKQSATDFSKGVTVALEQSRK